MVNYLIVYTITNCFDCFDCFYLFYYTIMKIGLLITIILSLVLSWCWLQQNDDFEKKVKCYDMSYEKSI